MKKKNVIRVIAGPNGSGKTSVANTFKGEDPCINADDLKEKHNLTDLQAAQFAEQLRHKHLEEGRDFSFETVLSTDRHLLFLEAAKATGSEIHVIFVLTKHPSINIARVKSRVARGGHDVPIEKIQSRYYKSLANIPHLISLSDSMLIYDNSIEPTLIYKKNDTDEYLYPTKLWPIEELQQLIGYKY